MNDSKTTKFSEKLHQTLHHSGKKHSPSIITELASGKLPLATFRYYLTQDTKYLAAFEKLHERTARPASLNHRAWLCLKSANGSGEDVQRSPMLQQFQLISRFNQLPSLPNNYAYITHGASASVDPAAAVTALLTCYWLYDEIADYWKDQTSPVPVYQAFFDSYQTVGFDTSTQQLISLVNELAANSSETVKQQMMTAFLRSSSYELGFWQMAYTHQTWADLADN